MKYRVSAFLLCISVLFSHTMYEAIPIRIKRIVHTTGKSHEGGESGGLLRDAKLCILSDVRSAESPPTKRGIAINKISFFQLIFRKNTS